MSAPTPADPGRMEQAVDDTLRSLQLRPEHAAIEELARLLARQIDAGQTGDRPLEALHKLSPRLAGVLRELGATPSSGRRGGDDDDHDDDAEQEVDELTRRRRTREDRAAGVDPATP